MGVGLGAMDIEAREDGDDEHAYGLAAYQSTFGKPATVKDYTELGMANIFQVQRAPPLMVFKRMRPLARNGCS